MKKKALALALAVMLVASLGIQPLAAELTQADIMPISADIFPVSEDIMPYTVTDGAADAELARITLIVKGTLDIEDIYDSFSGNFYDNGPVRSWNLSWSASNEWLSITTDNDGKIMNYSHNSSYDEKVRPYYYHNSFAPSFPTIERETAQVTAESFLGKVLGDSEGYILEDGYAVKDAGVSSHYFNGNLTVNGTLTDIYFNVSVNAETGNVSNFYRGDNGNILPGFPSNVPGSTADNAAELYAGTYEARLIYTPDYDLDPMGNTVVPRYFVAAKDSYIVDASTGKLINLTELYNSLNRNRNASSGSGFTSAESDAGYDMKEALAPQLSQVEIMAIEKYEGLLSVDELVAIIKADKAFNIHDDYKLYGSNFSGVSAKLDGENEEDELFTANIRFGYEVQNGDMWNYVNKNFTLNAKTGEIISLYGYSNHEVGDADYTAAAEAFLSERYPDQFAKSAAFSMYSYNQYATNSFKYVQMENDIPYPGNSLSVSILPTDGSILEFNHHWNDDVVFADASNLISAEQAIDAFMSTFDTKLVYQTLPVAVTPVDIVPLRAAFAEAGYSYVYENILAYTLDSNLDGYLDGIDAITGEPVVSQYNYEQVITYDDLDASYAADKIAKLAEYGIGFKGGSFEPTKGLAELDMLVFLLSAIGYNHLDSNEDIDWIYTVATDRGIITADHVRDENRAVTRVDLVRALINVTEYSVSAKLGGIWSPGFADDASIAATDLGYVAIARAIGMVHGAAGYFNPNSTISRQDAAIILYNYMSR